MLTVPEYASISSDLAVLTCFFNPFGCRHLQDNYIRFAAAIRESGVPLFTIECVFEGASPFVPDNGQTLCVTAESRCWQKERLLNLLETHVPAQYTKLAWVDADVLFDNAAWAYDTSDLLDEFTLVQLFERAIWLSKVGDDATPVNVPVTGQDYRSFTSRLPGSLSGHPGYAWAVRRSVWQTCGLFDRSGATSADFLMALASVGACAKQSGTVTGVADCYLQWADQFRRLIGGSIGTVPGVIRHLWHGDATTRNYHQFEQALQAVDFDPQLDLVLADNGTWTVPADRLQVQQVFNDYFQSRSAAANQMLLSIITPTYRRPELLASTLHAVAREAFTDVEHIVVSDGPDPAAEFLCSLHPRVRYADIPHSGKWGCAAKDAGAALASGRYLAFWDDDNVYYDGAVAAVREAVLSETQSRLLLMTVNYVHVLHRATRLLPSDGDGIQADFVDTSCLCVPLLVSRQLTWEDGGVRCRDFRYAARASDLCGGYRVVDRAICLHVDSYIPDVG